MFHLADAVFAVLTIAADAGTEVRALLPLVYTIQLDPNWWRFAARTRAAFSSQSIRSVGKFTAESTATAELRRGGRRDVCYCWFSSQKTTNKNTKKSRVESDKPLWLDRPLGAMEAQNASLSKNRRRMKTENTTETSRPPSAIERNDIHSAAGKIVRISSFPLSFQIKTYLLRFQFSSSSPLRIVGT